MVPHSTGSTDSPLVLQAHPSPKPDVPRHSLLLAATGRSGSPHDGASVALSVPALPRVRRTHASPTSRSSASGDQGETDLQAHNELQKFSQSATSVNFKPAQVDSVSVKDFPGNPIGTKRPEWTCTGKEGKDYRATRRATAAPALSCAPGLPPTADRAERLP